MFWALLLLATVWLVISKSTWFAFIEISVSRPVILFWILVMSVLAWLSTPTPPPASRRLLISVISVVFFSILAFCLPVISNSCEPLMASVDVAVIEPAATFTIWRSAPTLPTDIVPKAELPTPAKLVYWMPPIFAPLIAWASLSLLPLPSITLLVWLDVVLDPRINTSSSAMVLFEPIDTELLPLIILEPPNATELVVLAVLLDPSATEDSPSAVFVSPPAIALFPVTLLSFPPTIDA